MRHAILRVRDGHRNGDAARREVVVVGLHDFHRKNIAGSKGNTQSRRACGCSCCEKRDGYCRVGRLIFSEREGEVVGRECRCIHYDVDGYGCAVGGNAEYAS